MYSRQSNILIKLGTVHLQDIGGWPGLRQHLPFHSAREGTRASSVPINLLQEKPEVVANICKVREEVRFLLAFLTRVKCLFVQTGFFLLFVSFLDFELAFPIVITTYVGTLYKL